MYDFKNVIPERSYRELHQKNSRPRIRTFPLAPAGYNNRVMFYSLI